MAGKPLRIARTVELFVVLADRRCPGSEPVQDRALDHAHTLVRMRFEDGPLLLRRLPRLVEDLRRYGELANVVQQRCPVQSLTILCVERQLLGKQIGQGANSF